ncbi:hypothetical protein [Paraburkholderia terrae]
MTAGNAFLDHALDVIRLYRNGEDVVPLVPRAMHPWQHPGSPTAAGKPSLPMPNVQDHFIERVIGSLRSDGAGRSIALRNETVSL